MFDPSNTSQTAAASQSVRCLCQRRNASNLTIYSGLQVRTFIHRHH